MALNDAPDILREMRQQVIASLLARKPRISRRELHAYLAAIGADGRPRLANPMTGEPYSLATIQNDVQALRAEYRTKREQGRDQWIEQLLLNYEEMLSEAWKGKDIELARRVLSDVRKLLGLDAPQRQEISGSGGGPLQIIAIGGIDPDDDI